MAAEARWDLELGKAYQGKGMVGAEKWTSDLCEEHSEAAV